MYVSFLFFSKKNLGLLFAIEIFEIKILTFSNNLSLIICPKIKFILLPHWQILCLFK